MPLANGDEVQIGKYRLVFYASQRGVLTRPGPCPAREGAMLRTPSGGAGDGTAAADGRLLSIGAVLGRLRDEFPEVTISKIRFLEAEGLVEPQRTPSGYRKFSSGDVERLAHVLRMQRDHYLPLKVIKEHLDALDRGEQVPAAAGPRRRAAREPRERLRRPPSARPPAADRPGGAAGRQPGPGGGARRVGVVRAGRGGCRTAATTPRR